MSILTQQLPKTIEGAVINWDFRCMIRFEELLFSEGLTSDEKLEEGLKLFYPQGAPALTRAEAWEKLVWFYRCGLPAPRAAAGRKHSQQKRAYDFDVDAGRIAAAFQQAYGIDLTAGKPLHWWRFRALFENLPPDCRLCRIMDYRTADMTDLSPKTKAFYQRMQSVYGLEQRKEQPLTVKEHNESFIARLRREE